MASSSGAAFTGTCPMAPESLGGQQSSGFTAGAAEFILERPTINGSIPPLAFFTPTPMSQCGYGDALYGDWNEFTLPPDTGAEPFDGDVTYLNMVDTSNGDLLAIPALIPEPYDTNANSRPSCGSTGSR